MRLYLSIKEASILVSALAYSYGDAGQEEKDVLEKLLKRVDVCLELQAEPNGKRRGKKQKTLKKA